ncbi:phage tailspike protein [Chimaeribacter arupi]|uniref:phage tailspike protein n=1 Tax=Chimaeribacter arupi TaxID=2060066 RepID=UPI0013FD02C1|nr:phage tailspike protein [Chimaeribacter arupi]
MADITPNVVVSMPSQLFTAARAFKALAGGRIYLGKIDTDPTIAANRIQAYVENEDGSHIPIPQPILINLGGFPVYNGQVAKIVTVEGHSMAVYDLFGVQQFYFPNVLRYDPDQLRQQLASSKDGLGDYLIGVKQPFTGSVARSQHDKNKDFVSVADFIPPSVSTGANLCDAYFSAAEAAADVIYVPAGTYRLSTPMILGYAKSYYGPGVLRFDNAEWWRKGGSSGSVDIAERYTLFYNFDSQSDVSVTYDSVPQIFTWIDQRTIEAPGSTTSVSVVINIKNGYIKLGGTAEQIRSYNIIGNGGGGSKLTPQLPNPSTAPTGYDNTSFGARALMDMQSGVNNTALGSKALMSNQSGNNNTAVGFLALYRSSGEGNTAVGAVAGEWLTTGSYNSFFGMSAGEKITGGRYNVGVGFEAMAEASATTYTVAVGYRANGNPGDNSQSNSVYVGAFAGDFAIGSNNTMVGYRAGNCLGGATSPGAGIGHDNTFIGMFSGRNNLAGSESVVLGAGAATTATRVQRAVIAGFGACGNSATLGDFTVAVGWKALLNSTGTNNVGIGQQALLATTTGTGNVAVGSGALVTNTSGANNTAIGNNSGRLTQTGSPTAVLTNTTTVGNDARVSDSNQVQLGNSATTTYVYGTVQNRSDSRDKTDVENTKLGIDFIMGLRAVQGKWNLRDDYYEVVEEETGELDENKQPIIKRTVTFNEEAYKKETKKRTREHQWFIAQEVQALLEKLGIEDFGGLQHHSVNGGDDVYSLGYDEFIPPVVNAIQSCWKRLDDIEARLKSLEEK